LTKRHWVHFSEKDISFFRISFPHNFCEGLSPETDSAIQAEVSYDGDNPPDREELLKTVRRDLVKVGVLKPSHEVTFEDVHYVKYGYVVYDHYREAAVQRIHEFFHSNDIYPCGRYGSWEYLWADEAILDGRKTCEMVRDKLTV
jgi:UDP-galactopyranose mutase